jgi:hypothetical protein
MLPRACIDVRMSSVKMDNIHCVDVPPLRSAQTRTRAYKAGDLLRKHFLELSIGPLCVSVIAAAHLHASSQKCSVGNSEAHPPNCP